VPIFLSMQRILTHTVQKVVNDELHYSPISKSYSTKLP